MKRSVKRSTFLDGYKPNFATLCAAIKANRAAILECKDERTGELVACIVATNEVDDDDGCMEFVPLAKMLEGNPYEYIQPPNPAGGFEKVEEKGEK